MIPLISIWIFVFIHSFACSSEILLNDLKKFGKNEIFFYNEKQKTKSFILFRLGDSMICPSYLFRCDIIQCLPYAFVCNGEYNCQDKTDETNCSTAIINNNLCHTKYSINCEQEILHSTRLVDHGIQLEYTRPVQICIRR
jgi:hypothetical protein